MNAAPRFSVVSNELPDPPYPADIKANGWNPVQDIDRIFASDTWVLAEDDERPWLLRIWTEAWRSVPVGSMPADRRMFARRIGCKVAFLEAHAEILMRGWQLHADGNLYHAFIVSQVQEMLNTRSKNREKIREWRKQQAEKAERNRLQDASNQLLPGNLPVSNLYGKDRTGQELEEGDKSPLSEPPAGGPDAGGADEAAPNGNATGKPPASCPHQDIIALYHETLPELPAIVPSRWSGSLDAQALQSRWREDRRHRALDFWQAFFATVRTNPHWMGQNERGWTANLRWLVKRANFDKVIERMVENRRQEAAHG